MSKTYISEADFINGVLLRPVDFEVPSLGLVQVRGLSAVELGDLQAEFSDKPMLMMLKAVELCLVAPKLTEAGVKAMHEGNPGPIGDIATRILELSGQGDKLAQDPTLGAGS